MGIKVFFCYARRNEATLRKLKNHLKPLEEKRLIDLWDDGEISAGTPWEAKLNEHLNAAQVILLLVSSDFIASDYCYNVEMKKAVKRHERGEACVIPIIISPTHWQELPFGRLQALPKDGRPITKWGNREEAYDNIVDGIQTAIYKLSAETQNNPPLSPDDDEENERADEEKDSKSNYQLLKYDKQEDAGKHLSDADKRKYQYFEEQRAYAAQLLELNRPRPALEQIASLVFTDIPTYLRWRIVALRGQCHFAIRQFRPAQQDFVAATAFLPHPVPQDQHMEVILLYLHLAASLRELGQYDMAHQQYSKARSLMDASTPLRYIAEAHWGTSLVLYEQAYKSEGERLATHEANDQVPSEELSETFRESMEQARQHAENARGMYGSANELLQAALLNCHLALIEQALHQLDAAQQRLQHILDDWLPTLSDVSTTATTAAALPSALSEERSKRYTEKERANIVSATACYLASIERESNHYDAALAHIDLALQAGARSYIVRRADAYMTKGQILADRNDAKAIEAFRLALSELKNTDRLGAMIRVHKLLGVYLIRQGKKQEGEAELEKALQLANAPTQFSATAANGYLSLNNQEGESLINN